MTQTIAAPASLRSMCEEDLRHIFKGQGYEYAESFDREAGFLIVYARDGHQRVEVGPKGLILSLSMRDFQRSEMYRQL
jgi:hypothetical protein